MFTIFYGGRQVIIGSISLGEFIAFNSYISMLHWPVRSIGQIVNNIQRGLASLDRLEDVFSEKSDIKELEETVKIGEIKGRIEFKNVKFSYPGSPRKLLEDLSFKLEPGETLAIVGRMGSGKSTVFNLILRLYDIDYGEILIDDINIKDMSFKDLRENIAYVSQNNFLFSNSIKENIAFSFDHEIGDELVHEAARNADVYDNIVGFPEGFETVLGERGITLSGGQKTKNGNGKSLY